MFVRRTTQIMSVVDVRVALQRFMYLDNLIFYDDDDDPQYAENTQKQIHVNQ